MRDLATNQDACKNAVFGFTYSGTGCRRDPAAFPTSHGRRHGRGRWARHCRRRGRFRIALDPGGNGHASAGSLPTARPRRRARRADSHRHLGESTVIGSPLGQVAGGTKTINRYPRAAWPLRSPQEARAPEASRGHPIRSAAPNRRCHGRVRYTATPVLYSWVGAERQRRACNRRTNRLGGDSRRRRHQGRNGLHRCGEPGGLTLDVVLPRASARKR